MEAMVKKHQNKYNRVRDELAKWDELQTRLLSQYANASSVIERLPILMDSNNHGSLRGITGSRDALVGKQVESLEAILYLMKGTMKEFYEVVKSLEKLWCDCHQQLKGGSSPSAHHMQLRLGIQPCLTMCLDGLKTIYEMHHSEYLLKRSLISAITWSSTSEDLNTVRKLLKDQPNIPKDEMQSIFDTILPEKSGL